MVLEHQGDHASQWAAIASIAGKIGCTGETLRGWVRQAERDAGSRAGVTSDERARLKALERSYFPRFNLQAASYARGTGAQPDGSTGGALTGLGPNVQNWALGMTVIFPALELPGIRERKKAEAHREPVQIAFLIGAFGGHLLAPGRIDAFLTIPTTIQPGPARQNAV